MRFQKNADETELTSAHDDAPFDDASFERIVAGVFSIGVVRGKKTNSSNKRP